MSPLMKRLLPSPWLSAGLLLMWLLLADSISAGQVLFGLVVAWIAPWLTESLRPGTVRLRAPGVALRLIGHFTVDVIVSNLQLARSVLHGPSSAPVSAFVDVPLQLRDRNALAALAMIMSVVPGTLWCELSVDGATLRLHVFDLQDEAALIEEIRTRYERPLQEIFE